MSSQTTIDNLPVEMIYELFKYLQLKDLFACSLVNKYLREVYASFRLFRLAASDDSRFGWWHYPSRRVKEIEKCQLKLFGRLAEQPLLCNLKHLALSSQKKLAFDLNQFHKLVHLEIGGRLGEMKLSLTLPELRILAIHQADFPLSIDCPELSVLIYEGRADGSLLEVKHPETIRRLETYLFDPKLSRFKNVEYLALRSLSELSQLPEFEETGKAILPSLPRLRELHFKTTLSKLWFGPINLGNLLDRFKEALKEFLEEAERLKGSDFKFTLGGFLMTQTTLEEFDFGQLVQNGKQVALPDEYIIIKNWPFVDGIFDFITHLDYDPFIFQIPKESLSEFVQKFPRMCSVKANMVRDESHLLEFLRLSNSLIILNLESPDLDQEFYDQLPTAAPLLIKLNLGPEDGRDQSAELEELELNFDFVGKLPRLLEYSIRQLVPFWSLDSLIRGSSRLTRLEKATIYFRSINPMSPRKIFHISKSSKVWKISERGPWARTLAETQNTDEILNYLQALKIDSQETLLRIREFLN